MEPHELPEIEHYAFGTVRVGGQVFRSDLIILPGRIVADWWRERGHSLCVADLAAVLEAGPEALVVGTGAYGRMDVPPATREALERAGIELFAEPTAQACETYNRLRAGRRVAAALHLTC